MKRLRAVDSLALKKDAVKYLLGRGACQKSPWALPAIHLPEQLSFELKRLAVCGDRVFSDKLVFQRVLLPSNVALTHKFILAPEPTISTGEGIRA